MSAVSKTPNLLVVGEPGAGARSFVRGCVANALANQQPVLILDRGRNYEHFCRLMGGCVWHLNTTVDGKETTVLSTFEVRHPAPMQVCDFDATNAPWTAPIPGYDDVFQRAKGLLVVEDLQAIRARYPAVETLIAAHIGRGGRCCIVGRTDSELASVREMCEPAVFRKFVAVAASKSV
ncbi:hypothetical protein G3A43_08110 [Paraburkholderia aspalathi]|nr:hypothetical protein [Paraburkholderia aspalathi]MBK3780220.1 hypothetical protein [Paraburkholderia aspalathi]